MIWAIGLACAAGILVFHFINLARFRRQVFNQFELVQKIARQNRVVQNLRHWFLLLLRLAIVGSLALFINTCVHPVEKAESTLIIIPNLGIVSKPALQTVDSLINRSGLANASKSNIYTDDIRLKNLFPAITYEPNAGQYHTRYAKDGFGIDSIRIQRPDNLQVKRITDTSFLFTNIGGVPKLTVNDKTQTEEASRLPIELNTTPVSEVVVDGNRHFFAIRQTVKPRVFINPDASALLMTFNPALISLDKKTDNTQVLLGVHGFDKQVSQKAVFYIPNSLKETEKDFGARIASLQHIGLQSVGIETPCTLIQ